MAILSTKQRNALDTSEFGLPEERKFPLTDKSHVLKAIQFFKYCPQEKRAKLAKAINRKAKALGMKVHARGEFGKYIDKSVYSTEAVAITDDAWNMGTISPIVGGIPENSEPIKQEPILTRDKDGVAALLTDEFSLGFNEVEEGFPQFTIIKNNSSCKWLDNIKDEINRQESFRVFREPNDLGRWRYMFDMDPKEIKFTDKEELKPSKENPNLLSVEDSGRSNLIGVINDIIYRGEHNIQINYVCGNYRDALLSLTARNMILQDFEIAKSDEELVQMIIRHLIIAARTNEMFKFFIATIHKVNPKIASAVLHGVVRMIYKSNDYIPAIMADPELVGQFMNGLPKHATISKKVPNTIINDLYELATIYESDYGILDRKMCRWMKKEEDEICCEVEGGFPRISPDLVQLIHEELIDWYAFINPEKGKMTNLTKLDPYCMVLFIGKSRGENVGTVYRCIPTENLETHRIRYQMYGIGEYRDGKLDLTLLGRLMIKEREYRIQTGDEPSPGAFPLRMEVIPWAGKVNKEYLTEANVKGIIHRISDTIKGIRVGVNGDVKINLQNKLSFEHYEEVHKVIKENAKSGNMDALKENLAYVFALIGTIEKIYMNEQKGKGKRYVEADPEYQEMLRLRALLISDFKVYMRVVMKHDRTFDFVKYYGESDVNNSVYVLRGKDIKNVARLFRMILVN